MQKTNGSVVQEEDGLRYEKALFTYSEDEQQENEVARETAKLVFSPKFIPFYPEMIKFDLSVVEILIFGFIDFYLSNGSNKFYFTNEQIAKIVGCSESTVSNAFSNLKEKGIVNLNFRLKANGGKIRFVRLLNFKSPTSKFCESDTQILRDNKNKINKNKINKKERESKIEILPQQDNIFIKLLDDTDEKESFISAVVGKTGLDIDIVRNEINKFISYWTESNQKGKERWKMEKVFDVKRRLGTWFSNINKFNKPNNNLSKFIKIS